MQHPKYIKTKIKENIKTGRHKLNPVKPHVHPKWYKNG